jgi:hypothetical protein
VARPHFRAGQAVGISAVLAATVLVLVLPAPAIPVAAVGVVAAGTQLLRRRIQLSDVGDVLGVPVLVGLFGVAIALGTVGRLWPGPAVLLSHLDSVGTAALAAVASVVVNNLPAASLLGAKTPSHAFSLIVGLNLGPNLCVSEEVAVDGMAAEEFTEFILSRWAGLVRFGYGLTGDQGLVEDLAQTALTRLTLSAWGWAGNKACALSARACQRAHG